jgi:hypothetical protein
MADSSYAVIIWPNALINMASNTFHVKFAVNHTVLSVQFHAECQTNDKFGPAGPKLQSAMSCARCGEKGLTRPNLLRVTISYFQSYKSDDWWLLRLKLNEVYITHKRSLRTSQKTLCFHTKGQSANVIYRNNRC